MNFSRRDSHIILRITARAMRACMTLLLLPPLTFTVVGCATAAKKPAVIVPLPHASDTQPVQPPIEVEGAAPSAEDTVIELEPLRIQVVRDSAGEERVIATDARSIFDEGNDALAEGDFERALGHYDDLLTDFADSRLAQPALYNAGLALEGLDRVDDAVQRYLRLARLDRHGSDGIDARIRAAALYAEHQRWNESLAVLDDLLAIEGLGPSDALEGRARRGYVLLEAKDYSAAEQSLTSAIAFYATQSAAGVAFQGDYYLAMAHFYLGDIARRQFEAIPIRLPEAQMQRDVEAKAGLVNLGSKRFDDTIELGNIYWATAAGFRIAEMQASFWRELVTAPIPPHLGKEAAGLYVAEVHRMSLSLLEKALSYHSKNVQLATVYKSETPWSQASADQALRLTEVIGREQAGAYLTAQEASAPAQSGPRRSPEYMPGRIEL